MSWSPFSSRNAFRRMGAANEAGDKGGSWRSSSAWETSALAPEGSSGAGEQRVDNVTPTIVVAAKRNVRLALLLLTLDFAACGATAFVYWVYVPPVVRASARDSRRLPAIVGVALIALLFACVLGARMRYVVQSNRSRCTGSVRWHLASVMQPLLSIPALSQAPYVWLLCGGVWRSTASLVFFGTLFVCTLVNLQAAHKHRRTLKMHIVALEHEILRGYNMLPQAAAGGASIDARLERATRAHESGDEFDSVDVERADDNEPMRIDEPPRRRPQKRAAHSTAPARRAPRSPRGTRRGKRRGTSSRGSRAATLASGATTASHTSVDDAEESGARIDAQPW